MYRDDPLDDESELRAVVGDGAVDEMLTRVGADGVLAALDAMRLLQGWVDDAACARWLTGEQRRLGGRSPLTAIADGDTDEVNDVLRAFLAAQS